ncbi:MAG: hypothetical protein GQ542_07385, partial [Desulforhopalus sp.]|nr:hypothetical protein [Desulforhopalus sp.]
IEDFLKSGFDHLSDESIKESIKTVYDIYSSHGKTDGTAKAKYFTDSVIESVIANELTQTANGKDILMKG